MGVSSAYVNIQTRRAGRGQQMWGVQGLKGEKDAIPTLEGTSKSLLWGVDTQKSVFQDVLL